MVEHDPTIVERVGELYLLGLTQQVIATRLGISQPTVSNYIARARVQWRDTNRQTYEDLVDQEFARLDMLNAALELGIRTGEPQAVNTAIRLSERRAKLAGLDKSDKLDEVRVQLEARRLDMVAAAFTEALDATGLAREQRQIAIESFLAALEPAGMRRAGAEPDASAGAGSGEAPLASLE